MNAFHDLSLEGMILGCILYVSLALMGVAYVFQRLFRRHEYDQAMCQYVERLQQQQDMTLKQVNELVQTAEDHRYGLQKVHHHQHTFRKELDDHLRTYESMLVFKKAMQQYIRSKEDESFDRDDRLKEHRWAQNVPIGSKHLPKVFYKPEYEADGRYKYHVRTELYDDVFG